MILATLFYFVYFPSMKPFTVYFLSVLSKALILVFTFFCDFWCFSFNVIEFSPMYIRAHWDSVENQILHLEFCLICIWRKNSILETFLKTTFLIRGHLDMSKWIFKFGWKYKGFSKFIKGQNFQRVSNLLMSYYDEWHWNMT